MPSIFDGDALKRRHFDGLGGSKDERKWSKNKRRRGRREEGRVGVRDGHMNGEKIELALAGSNVNVPSESGLRGRLHLEWGFETHPQISSCTVSLIIRI